MPKTSGRIRFAHCSMQFSDSPRQQRHDADKLFARFAKKGTKMITGTEAGQFSLRRALRRAARKHGYKIYIKHGEWVAVKKSFIIGGSWTKGYEHALNAGASRTGKHTARGVVWASFDNALYGHITVGAGHYLTKGRPGAKGLYAKNTDLNRRYAEVVGKWARKHGAGAALVFYGGDQNIVDQFNDTFFGEPLTSVWDELAKWENTGHGNIDVWATFDWDGRVEAAWIDAKPDSEFFLHMDHFLVEGAVAVEYLEPV